MLIFKTVMSQGFKTYTQVKYMTTVAQKEAV